LTPLQVLRAGRVDYAEALALQRELVEDRHAGRIPDTLVLLEHPHVLTVGVRQRTSRANIVAAPEHLAALGVKVFDAGRGGDVTYHGPGQLVGYPILDLRPDRQDVHRYVRDLEDVLIRSCAAFGVQAQRLRALSGVWVETQDRPLEKVAAIGVRIARWVTSHGFALNVNTDLEFFRLIIPCGIADRGVTSLQALVGRPLAMARAEDVVIEQFARVFECEVIPTLEGVMQ
jgi:lipoyl(octanoyl) transferase